MMHTAASSSNDQTFVVEKKPDQQGGDCRHARAPDRPHDLYYQGEWEPDPAIWADDGEIEHIEVVIDAFGDPDSWPGGWWGARIWLKSPADQAGAAES